MDMKNMKIDNDLVNLLQQLRPFVDPMEMFDEGLDLNYPVIKDMIRQVVDIINFMPSFTYPAESPTAFLHYSLNETHFYISSIDGVNENQRNAFGCICRRGRISQMDFISIPDIIRCGARLDLGWKPIPLNEVYLNQLID